MCLCRVYIMRGLVLLKWILSVVFVCLFSVCAVQVMPAMAQNQAKRYNAQAAAWYKDAELSFQGADYLEAIRRYNLIRAKFPYTSYAKLADLRIADAYFAQEKYATAVEQYRTFSKLYPEHPKVLYAKWRVAYSFYEQMPKDWFLIPPGYERDLARARDAEREMRFFLRRHSKSEYAAEAKMKLALVRRRLADHEFYVARFYLKRKNPQAAALRLTYMLKNYSGLGLDPNALFLLARAYLELKDVDKALVALRDLIDVHPQSHLAGLAKEYVQMHGLTLPQ